MMQDMQPREQSRLFRNTRLCLMLLGYGCLIVAGVYMLRFSVGRDGADKFTALGIAAIAVALLGAIWTIRRIAKGQQ
jgi:hypothetical protein